MPNYGSGGAGGPTKAKITRNDPPLIMQNNALPPRLSGNRGFVIKPPGPPATDDGGLYHTPPHHIPIDIPPRFGHKPPPGGYPHKKPPATPPGGFHHKPPPKKPGPFPHKLPPPIYIYSDPGVGPGPVYVMPGGQPIFSASSSSSSSSSSSGPDGSGVTPLPGYADASMVGTRSIPTWVWIAGGAAALWLLTRKKGGI